jgi:hypothetical protein
MNSLWHSPPIKYPPSTHQVTPQVGELVKVLDGETSRLDIQQALNLVDKVSFRLTYLQPAIEQGFVSMKLNDSKLNDFKLNDYFCIIKKM